MKVLKSYSHFLLSEGLTDQMIPKSEDDVRKSLSKLNLEDKIMKIKSLGLDSSFLPPREEIENFLKNFSTKEILDKNKDLGLDSSFLPPKEEIEKYLSSDMRDRLRDIKKYNLDDTFLPPKEEIKRFLSDMSISNWIGSVSEYGLNRSFLPSNSYIENIMKEKYEDDEDLKFKAEALLEYLKDNDYVDDDMTIYWLEPDSYDFYGMSHFTNLNGSKYEAYAVGTDDEADKAFYDYEKDLIDDLGMDGFSPGFIDNYIDGERLADYFMQGEEDYYRDEWRDYGIEGVLTSSAEKEIEEKEEEIARLEKERDILDSSDEGADELDEQIEEINSEIDDIKEDEDNYEVDEDDLERYIDNQKDEIINDPVGYLKNRFGYEGKELNDQLEDFIDKDEIIEVIKNSDGRGVMSGYDGDENEIQYNNTWYYIYRTN